MLYIAWACLRNHIRRIVLERSELEHRLLQLYSTANIKAVRGSLWSISVNKLSHIPKLQPVSAVYKNQ